MYRTPQATPREGFVLVRTDVAGFLGFAERGPLPAAGLGLSEQRPADELPQGCLKLTSWREYQVHFGGFTEHGYLAYAVRGFFENGGDACYVVRVAAVNAANAGERPAAAIASLPLGEGVAAGTLKAVVDPWTITLEPAGDPLKPLDAVEIRTSTGLRLSATVDSITGAGEIRLNRRLVTGMGAGDQVLSYDAWARVSARSAGNWGNRIRVLVLPLETGAVSLRCELARTSLRSSRETEFYSRLDLLNPDRSNYAERSIQDTSRLISLQLMPEALARAGGAIDKAYEVQLGGGRDGLAAVNVADFKRNLALLAEIEDIGAVAIPDAAYAGTRRWKPKPVEPPPCSPAPDIQPDPSADDRTATPPAFSQQQTAAIYRDLVSECERLRYRVAILDVPDLLQPRDAGAWAERNDLRSRSARFGALYYPWLEVPDELSGLRRRVPAAGHVAGIYARNDLTRGVQHPPANLEMSFVDDLTELLDDDAQGPLNQESLNVIRSLPGRGIRVWGARSLAPAGDSEWRFIHTRRLLSAIEQTVEKSTMWAVFAVNDHNLRETMVHSLNVLLEGIWTSGGLKGDRPEQGFYVKCDDTNNPQSSIDAGLLICEVGVAIAAPMEFIVFEIRRNAGGSEIVEV